MKNTLWIVTHPNTTCPMTVIAASADEARQIAADAEEADDGPDEYTAEPCEAGEHWVGSPLRWVSFGSPGDAENQCRDLEAVGVALSDIRRRAVTSGLGNALWWEVGAKDPDWCRLGAGVLCGGEQ